METFNAKIDRKENSAKLKLLLDECELCIALSEDNPNEVKIVFNKLLEKLKNSEFDFKLIDDKEDLYFHICKEYLTQLNAELKSTYKELRDNGLIKTAD